MKMADNSPENKAFTLVEVVLAIGVIAIAVVALLGLMVPTLSSVRNVIDTSQATAAMSKFNAYLDNDEDLGFNELFDIVTAEGDYYVYEVVRDGGGTEIRITDNKAEADADYRAGIAGTGGIVGPVFRFLLSRSSMWDVEPVEGEEPVSKWDEIDQEAYFPIYVRVLIVQPELIGGQWQFPGTASSDYIDRHQILSYTTAKLR